MSDQNRFDEYKQKLLQWWQVFLEACGKYWEIVKTRTGTIVQHLGRDSKVLLQKLAAWTLKARAALKKGWAHVCREGKKLLRKLAAWALELREKAVVLSRRAREWGAAFAARFSRPRSADQKAMPAVEEAAVLPEPETFTEAVEQIQEAVPEETAVPLPQTANASLQKAGEVLKGAGNTVKFIVKWLWKLRTVFMAIPVVITAVKFAMENMERLPESVGLDIQSSGEFATMISRQEAVYWPLGITLFCLVLMFCSKKPLLPWVVSIFTLVLPWLIWLLNYYA